MSSPDVTVIVPVFNTMPYLKACLESLVSQSIGAGRMTVIAVDDGSTDGSGEEIDRFAAEHPGLVTAIHQANSGGPAGPCNRGLELATGRYVYFVGADDYLGPEALERMVRAADEWHSDVLLAKIIGVGGRKIFGDIFAEQAPRLDLFDSQLPYAMGNVKLFRRSLIEELGLRFPEGLPMGSDQPFTFEAMLNARTISVLADYDCYFAVRREDSGNITFSASDLKRVRNAARIMDFVAGLVEAGPRRDAVLRRHFDWELAESLQLGFLTAPADEQREICSLIGRLSDDYFTPAISEELRVSRRLRLNLARNGRIDDLVAFIGAEFGPDAQQPPFVSDGDRLFMAYAGFGEEPDDLYEVHHRRIDSQIVKRSGLRAAEGVVTADVPLVVRSGRATATLLRGDTVLDESPLRSWPGHRSSPISARGDAPTSLRVPVADVVVDLPVSVEVPRRSFGHRLRSRLRRG